MKLIFCRACHDIRKLTPVLVNCSCGKSYGYYTDDLNAVIGGQCIPLGFVNQSFVSAIKNQPETGQGFEFTAFVIPKKCPTIKDKGR